MAKTRSSRCTLIFGGTFDPPHRAHAVLPPLAADMLGCDRIIYIPARINPLKRDAPASAPAAAPEHRLAMLLLATANVPNARISSIELERQGNQPSYTIDTLKMLRAKFKSRNRRSAATLRLLIGSDQALDFHRWKSWREILKLATPSVMLRTPWNRKSFERELRKKYSKAEADRWLGWTLDLPLIDISATKIRQLLAKGDYKSLRDDLDPAVLEYISVNGMYRNRRTSRKK